MPDPAHQTTAENDLPWWQAAMAIVAVLVFSPYGFALLVTWAAQ